MKKKDMEFGKYWVLSTAHITEKESKLLSKESRLAIPALVVYSYEYGYWVHVPSYDAKGFKEFIKQVKTRGYSKSFITLLHCALDNDCQFIKFDADGETVSGLKKFDW